MDGDDSQRYAQDFAAIACDSSDNLYVSYLDNRWLMRGEPSDHYQMHLQRSTNNGATWSNPVIANKLSVLSSGTCECCRQDIAASPEGHVYIAFRTSQELSSTLDDRSIFICRSWDKGATWDNSIRCQLGTWNLTACPSKGPHISLDKSEDLFLAWNDARDDSAAIISYFAILPRGETTIFPNYSMSPRSLGGTWPSVAMSPLGYIAYAFMPSGGPVQFSYSSDGGNTWNRNRALPGRSGDDQSLPSIEFDAAGHALLAYQDADSNAILFTEISGMSPRPQLAQPISLIPNLIPPSPQTVLHWHTPAGLGVGNYVWYTFEIDNIKYGPILTRDTELVVPVSPAISYHYLIAAHTTFDSAITGGSFTTLDSESLGVTKDGGKRTAVIPNPVDGIVTFQINGLLGLASVDILNSVGSTVKSLDAFAVDEAVKANINGLPPGAYRARITNVAGSWLLPFIIR
jgi:hypothetical protein